MTQLPLGQTYQANAYYFWAREGQPQEHAKGTSCDNLVACGIEHAAEPATRQATAPQLHGRSVVPKPARSESLPTAAPTTLDALHPAPLTHPGSAATSPTAGDAAMSSQYSQLSQYSPWLPESLDTSSGPVAPRLDEPQQAQHSVHSMGSDCDGYTATNYYAEMRRLSVEDCPQRSTESEDSLQAWLEVAAEQSAPHLHNYADAGALY